MQTSWFREEKRRRLVPVLVILGVLLGSPWQYLRAGNSEGSYVAEAALTPGKAALEGKININQANAEELTRLPGVGMKTAGNIVHYREEHGPFKSVEDLSNVKGIGGKKLEKIREQIKL